MTDTVPASPARIDRVVSADARDVLERIEGSSVLREGGVNLIGLDAIRQRLGERWAGKRARVWEHVERELEKRLGPHDMFARMDETSYLVAMPTAGKFAAQAACLHIVQDVLKFFLGEANMRDVAVRTVASVSGGEIVSANLDPSEIAARPPSSPPISEEPTKHEDWKPPLAGRTRAVSLMTVKREPLQVRIAVEPVWNLRLGLVTSFLVERQAQPAPSDPMDTLAVDRAILGYAAELFKEHGEKGGGKLTLHVPVSFSSVASVRAREEALAITRPYRDIVRKTMLLELCDLDPGVPPSRLLEIVSLLRPFCLGVLARVRPTRKALEAVKGCGLQGLILDAHPLGRNEADLRTLMKGFVEVGHGLTPNLIVHGLPAPEMVDAAQASGMTHASVWPDLRFDKVVEAA